MTHPRRRPRPLLRPLSHVTGRDAVWAVIRELAHAQGDFTRHDLCRRICAGEDLVREYLRLLVAAGFVLLVAPATHCSRGVYRLIADQGVEAPRVCRDGTLDDRPSDQERMWQAMKALPRFCVADLQAATGIAKRASAAAYVKHLHRAGYLVVIEAATPRQQARYRLLPGRNTGPRPPVVRRGKIVFDTNTGRQVWPEVTP